MLHAQRVSYKVEKYQHEFCFLRCQNQQLYDPQRNAWSGNFDSEPKPPIKCVL